MLGPQSIPSTKPEDIVTAYRSGEYSRYKLKLPINYSALAPSGVPRRRRGRVILGGTSKGGGGTSKVGRQRGPKIDLSDERAVLLLISNDLGLRVKV